MLNERGTDAWAKWEKLWAKWEKLLVRTRAEVRSNVGDSATTEHSCQRARS
jgi:hypothetical protein